MNPPTCAQCATPELFPKRKPEKISESSQNGSSQYAFGLESKSFSQRQISDTPQGKNYCHFDFSVRKAHQKCAINAATAPDAPNVGIMLPGLVQA